MKTTILANLDRIEQENNVRIIYAVESGSRAWGFASKDSDYDVRFIYMHPLEWYLSIRKRRDVIECPISGDLDISGWDLPKALGLFRKSNPPLLEWLGSPHIYLDRYGLAERLRELMAVYYSPKRCMLHYLHMARGNFREYLKGEMVRVKKYFYVLRPILACLWIERNNSMPPTEFFQLYRGANLSPSLEAEIDRLLVRKMAGDEMDMEPRIEAINSFLEQQIDHCSAFVDGMDMMNVDEDVLDALFRKMLHTVWEPLQQQETLKAIAVKFYEKRVYGIGKASELCSVSRTEFLHILKEKQVHLNYDDEELDRDICTIESFTEKEKP